MGPAHDLNDAILVAARSLPLRRGYRFDPAARRDLADPANPRDAGHDGVSQHLFHKGQRVAVAADDGMTYCCGVTFEAWFAAASGVGQLDRFDPSEIRQLIADWFCPSMGHGGAATALVSRDLGVPVAPSEAQPGDLLQFWRSVDLARPSGHSVVFLAWEGPKLRYWSSQPATTGVGEHVEEPTDAWTLHFARARSFPEPC